MLKFGIQLLLAAVILLVLIFVFLTRLLLVLRAGSTHKPGKTGPLTVFTVAGSGGHTTEILRLLGSLSQSYSPTHYIMADSDKMSEDKICSFERSRGKQSSKFQYFIHRIPRSREVRQSWSSSVLTTLRSLLYSLPLTFRLKPDLVLCNGPGTCVPVCASAVLLGILGIKKVIIIYVESICRVENLSLSGRILYHFSDYFIVQWPVLKEKYPKSVYLGRIV
ncbi:UDP-N-acetylglucosamine transferase subunit ALG14 isoform X1 [Microcaecilia unicolor]|uniref:UDP-N-acetylglucosamine transferase subunit ALG14 n=1 Tax=Microcaecilia unicolor TaxID=1415580 RepID=A0A6P7YJL0_9AMPH|nr:UDP-N-acetylglucosamine transferase subunit ALG14 homolog isoform X1 [Microcaecilia unicolor]